MMPSLFLCLIFLFLFLFLLLLGSFCLVSRCHRCISATMIWNVTGRNFVSLPLVVYYLHLSIGDAWNNLYTVQKRLGAGAFFIWFVWASVLGLTAVFYKTLPVAGYIIAPSAVWLSIASLLVTRIWELNRKEPQVLIPQSTSESDEAKQ